MKHTISYAYPHSPMADIQGHGYYVEHNGAHARFDAYAEALAYAQGLGSEPDRWSIDHPSNTTFLKQAELARVHHSRASS
jgi:hypothetical protein